MICSNIEAGSDVTLLESQPAAQHAATSRFHDGCVNRRIP